MTVIFNDIVLANGESRTAKCASGLAPSGTLNFEPLEFLRAVWAQPVARGNRLITLPMVIEIPAHDTFGEALVSGLNYFANLPDEGPLVIAEGSDQVTFSSAVCADCKVVEEILGLSYAVALRFVCGQPTNATLSTLAQYDMRNVANLHLITGLTGGGTTKLDGYTTTDVKPGFQLQVFAAIGGLNQLATFRLYAGTDATNTDPDAGPVIVRPADYDAGSNAKVWKRLDA